MERAFKICAEGKGDELTKDQLFNYLCALGNPSQFAHNGPLNCPSVTLSLLQASLLRPKVLGLSERGLPSDRV